MQGLRRLLVGRIRPLFVTIRRRTLYRISSVSLTMMVGLFFMVNAGPSGTLHGWRFAVDAGHGGEDRGVCYFEAGLIEKEVNLEMAFRLARALEAEGAAVFMTRSDDTFISLEERARLGNEFGADLFISMHVNRIPGHPDCFGAQTFYFPSSVEGRRLAYLIQEELLRIDPENYRQPMPGRFAVLRQSEMPGALVEIAFMTNERDRQLLQEAQYRERVIAAIVEGIHRYVHGEDVSETLHAR